MAFKGESGFGRLTNLMMNVFIGVILGTTFLILLNDISSMSATDILIAFLQAFVLSVCAGYTLGDLLPAMALGQALCEKLQLQSTLAQLLVKSLILDLINVTCILFVCMFVSIIKTGGIGMVVQVSLGLLPAALGIGFLGIALTLPLAIKIANSVSKFNPNAASTCTRTTK